MENTISLKEKNSSKKISGLFKQGRKSKVIKAFQ